MHIRPFYIDDYRDSFYPSPGDGAAVNVPYNWEKVSEEKIGPIIKSDWRNGYRTNETYWKNGYRVVAHDHITSSQRVLRIIGVSCAILFTLGLILCSDDIRRCMLSTFSESVKGYVQWTYYSTTGPRETPFATLEQKLAVVVDKARLIDFSEKQENDELIGLLREAYSVAVRINQQGFRNKFDDKVVTLLQIFSLCKAKNHPRAIHLVRTALLPLFPRHSLAENDPNLNFVGPQMPEKLDDWLNLTPDKEYAALQAFEQILKDSSVADLTSAVENWRSLHPRTVLAHLYRAVGTAYQKLLGDTYNPTLLNKCKKVLDSAKEIFNRAYQRDQVAKIIYENDVNLYQIESLDEAEAFEKARTALKDLGLYEPTVRSLYQRLTDTEIAKIMQTLPRTKNDQLQPLHKALTLMILKKDALHYYQTSQEQLFNLAHKTEIAAHLLAIDPLGKHNYTSLNSLLDSWYSDLLCLLRNSTNDFRYIKFAMNALKFLQMEKFPYQRRINEYFTLLITLIKCLPKEQLDNVITSDVLNDINLIIEPKGYLLAESFVLRDTFLSSLTKLAANVQSISSFEHIRLEKQSIENLYNMTNNYHHSDCKDQFSSIIVRHLNLTIAIKKALDEGTLQRASEHAQLLIQLILTADVHIKSHRCICSSQKILMEAIKKSISVVKEICAAFPADTQDIMSTLNKFQKNFVDPEEPRARGPDNNKYDNNIPPQSPVNVKEQLAKHCAGLYNLIEGKMPEKGRKVSFQGIARSYRTWSVQNKSSFNNNLSETERDKVGRVNGIYSDLRSLWSDHKEIDHILL